jgi:peptide/nickel transport system substrate-binding protein
MEDNSGMRKVRWALSLVLVLLIAATGCSTKKAGPAPSGGSTSVPGAKKDTITVALDSDYPTMDPHMHNERNAIIINWHIFDSLLTRDPETMAVVPHLAESFKAVNDTTWELKLRKDVKFHNGEEFNADSVKFTFDRVLDEKTKSPQRGNISAVKEVKVIDPYTVQLITNAPYPLLPERLTYFCMLPPKYFNEVGADKFGQSPVGTGPYKFGEWKKGDRVILKANEEYWKGAPQIKNVVFRTIREQATQLNELAAGGVDLIWKLPPENIPQVEKAGATITTTEILRFWHISMNPAFKPLQDKNFRLAMAHAINVDAIIAAIFEGKATRIAAMVNPKQFGFDPSVKPFPYDPEKAKQYLKQSSYKGEKLTLHYYMKGTGNAVMDAIAGDLKQVGINVETKFYPETNTLVELNRSGKTEMDAGTWGSFSTFDADAVLEPFLSLKGTYGATHQFAPDQNQLIADARATLDAPKRKELYTKLQKLVVDEAMDISLFSPLDIYGMHKDLNYKPRADEVIYLYQASWK